MDILKGLLPPKKRSTKLAMSQFYVGSRSVQYSLELLPKWKTPNPGLISVAVERRVKTITSFVVNVSTYTGSSTPNTVFLSVASWSSISSLIQFLLYTPNFLRIHLKPTPDKSHQVTQVTPDKSHQVTPNKSRQVTQVTPDKSHQEQEDSALSHRSPDRQTGAFKHEQQFCFIPKLKE